MNNQQKPEYVCELCVIWIILFCRREKTMSYKKWQWWIFFALIYKFFQTAIVCLSLSLSHRAAFYVRCFVPFLLFFFFGNWATHDASLHKYIRMATYIIRTCDYIINRNKNNNDRPRRQCNVIYIICYYYYYLFWQQLNLWSTHNRSLFCSFHVGWRFAWLAQKFCSDSQIYAYTMSGESDAKQNVMKKI